MKSVIAPIPTKIKQRKDFRGDPYVIEEAQQPTGFHKIAQRNVDKKATETYGQQEERLHILAYGQVQQHRGNDEHNGVVQTLGKKEHDSMGKTRHT